MGTVLLDMTISVDGYIAPEGSVDTGLHNWYFSPSPQSAQVIDELVQSIAVLIMGKRTYAEGAANGGFADDPYTRARFVLTHQIPTERPAGTESFVFVTTGIADALQQAQAAAGDGIIAIGGGAETARQYLHAGLVDEIQLHVVPKLLGSGVRLFDGGASPLYDLEPQRIITAPNVTHMRYRIAK